MTILCNNCVHKGICKFQSGYEKTIEHFTGMNVEVPFSLSLNCTHYKVEQPSYTYLNINDWNNVGSTGSIMASSPVPEATL